MHNAKPSGRKTIHDFSLNLLKCENKEVPVSIERIDISSLQELRKELLQNKYQPVIKRLERKVSMQVKKGTIEIEKERRKFNLEEAEEKLAPIESLRSLYSADTELPKDPYMNINDIIDVSVNEVLKVLIIGPPRSGKTTLATELSKSLDLHHIELSSIITRLIAKGKKDEEEEQAEEEEPEDQGGAHAQGQVAGIHLGCGPFHQIPPKRRSRWAKSSSASWSWAGPKSGQRWSVM